MFITFVRLTVNPASRGEGDATIYFDKKRAIFAHAQKCLAHKAKFMIFRHYVDCDISETNHVTPTRDHLQIHCRQQHHLRHYNDKQVPTFIGECQLYEI